MPLVRSPLESAALMLGENLGKAVAGWGIEHERDGQVVLMFTMPDGTTYEFTGRVASGERDVA